MGTAVTGAPGGLVAKAVGSTAGAAGGTAQAAVSTAAGAPEPRADVAVIGGGIIGLACAYALAQRGARVALFEKGRLGGEQSSRNWGFVRQQGRDPVETPLMAASNRLWRGLEAELEADVEWEEGGNLALAATEADLARFEEAAAVCRRFGVVTEILGRDAVARLVPGLAGPYLGGLYTGSDGQADPLKATLAFARAAARHGARLHTYCAVEGVRVRSGRIAGVVTEKGEVEAPYVVCAAGAHASRLARMAGLSLPQRMVRSTVALTVPLPPVTRAAVWGLGVAFRQTRAGGVVLGRASAGSAIHDLTLDSFRHLRLFLPMYLENREFLRMRVGRPLWDDLRRSLPWSRARRHPFAHTVDVEPAPSSETAEACRLAFMAHFPALGEVRIERTWAGVIDATPDLVPVLGEARALPGFVLAAGFSGHGFAMAPIVGRLVAELILDGRPSLDIRGMRLERFAEGDFGKARKVL